jgi:uncharacterized protein
MKFLMTFLSRTNKMRTIFFLVLALLASSLMAQDIPVAPSPMKFVNDYANILSPSDNAALERKLRDYNDSTSTQIVVVTVASLGKYEVEQVSYKIASTWGIGQKGKNNGVLIFVAPSERKMRIEVGFGLEGSLTDIQTKSIITDIMRPRFKENNYAGGLEEATNAIMQMIAGTYKRDGTETDKKSKGGGSFSTVLIVLGVIILIIYLSGRRGGRGGSGTTFYSGGYYFGGGGSSYSDGGGSSFDFGGGDFGGGGSSGDW